MISYSKQTLLAVGLSTSFSLFAQTAPLACDGSAYLVSARNGTTPSVINIVDGNDGLTGRGTITPSIADVYNALAYNTTNNLLYALVDEALTGSTPLTNLVTIDATGVVTDLGKPTPSGVVNIPWVERVGPTVGLKPDIGTINGGTFYTHGIDSVNNKYYLMKVDLASMTYTETELTANINNIYDFAFSKQTGLLYGLSNSSVVTIDPVTGQVNNILSGSYVTAGGGVWADDMGDIFFYVNNSRELYKLDLSTDPANPTITNVSSVAFYGRFDATACYRANPNKRLINTSIPQTTPFNSGFEEIDLGETLNYEIYIVNVGSQDRINVPVKDSLLASLPSGVSLVAGPVISSGPGNLRRVSTGNYEIDVLPAGATVTITYTLNITSNPTAFAMLSRGGVLENSITVDGSQPPASCTAANQDECVTIPFARGLGGPNGGSASAIPSSGIAAMLMLMLAFASAVIYRLRKIN